MRTAIVGTILVFCFFVVGCSGWLYEIRTENMSPTLKIGDRCFVNKYEGLEIRRFDIAVLNLPEDIKKRIGETGDVKIISRVIGLPNEKIEVKQGKVYINDQLLHEPFEKTPDPEKDFSAFVIPENEYFLMGDNRPQSLDSRYWKKPTVPKKEISGSCER